MAIKLRVIHGTLKHQDGAHAGLELDIPKKRFIVGSGADCNMRCASSTISPQHCEISAVGDGYAIRDLNSSSGTFINGHRLVEPHTLCLGDHLRIGKLEFEVVGLTPPRPVKEVARPEPDAVGDSISEMLVEADKEERARRLDDPATRSYTVELPEAAPKPVEEPAKKKLAPPPKRPPIKLPPPPKVVSDNTVQAAEEVLKKFLEKPKK